MRDIEEPRISMREMERQDEWERIYRAACEAGIGEAEAREIADDTIDYNEVGLEVYYGVSRGD